MKPNVKRRVQAQRKFALGAYIPPAPVVAIPIQREVVIAPLRENQNVSSVGLSAKQLLDFVSLNKVHTHKHPVVLIERMAPGTKPPENDTGEASQRSNTPSMLRAISARRKSTKLIYNFSTMKRRKLNVATMPSDVSDFEDEQPLKFLKNLQIFKRPEPKKKKNAPALPTGINTHNTRPVTRAQAKKAGTTKKTKKSATENKMPEVQKAQEEELIRKENKSETAKATQKTQEDKPTRKLKRSISAKAPQTTQEDGPPIKRKKRKTAPGAAINEKSQNKNDETDERCRKGTRPSPLRRMPVRNISKSRRERDNLKEKSRAAEKESTNDVEQPTPGDAEPQNSACETVPSPVTDDIPSEAGRYSPCPSESILTIRDVITATEEMLAKRCHHCSHCFRVNMVMEISHYGATLIQKCTHKTSADVYNFDERDAVLDRPTTYVNTRRNSQPEERHLHLEINEDNESLVKVSTTTKEPTNTNQIFKACIVPREDADNAQDYLLTEHDALLEEILSTLQLTEQSRARSELDAVPSTSKGSRKQSKTKPQKETRSTATPSTSKAPAASSSKEPADSSSEAAAASSSSAPAAPSSQASAASSSSAPAASSSSAPAAPSAQASAASSSNVPAASSSSAPAAPSSQASAASSSNVPAASSSSAPAAPSSQAPAASSSQAPGASSSQAPAASSSQATAAPSSKKEKKSSPKTMEAPTYYLTDEDMTDPISFYEKKLAAASKYGICKVVAPPGWKPACILNDDMRFAVSNHYISRMYSRWGSAAREICAMKAYLASQNVLFERIPLLDCMEANLPRLYSLVQSYGGLQEVIEKKRWTRVAEELGLTVGPHTEKNLDNYYVKHLLPYDTANNSERDEIKASVEKCWNRKYRKMVSWANNPLHSKKKLLGESDSSDESDTESFNPLIENALQEAEDCVVPGRKMNYKAFKTVAKKAKKLYLRKNIKTTADIEKEYWKCILLGNEHVCVNAASIDTTASGYGFSKNPAHECSQHCWNLKKLANNPGNLLRSMGQIVGVTEPALHLGMLFSTSCWHRDPHGLPWMEYMHDGPPKTWYGIPDEQSGNFRKAVESLCPTSVQNKSIWLSSDIAMIPPDLLREHNVSFSHTVQRPGEYVIVFPKAYSCAISTGLTVSESCYFAPISWLKTVHQVFQENRDGCEPTMFALEHLLLSLANDPRSTLSVLQQVHSSLSSIVGDELKNRRQLDELRLKRVSGSMATPKEGEDEGPDECDVCRATLYLSKVKGMFSATSLMCLKDALRVLQSEKYKGMDVSNMELVIHHTEKQLEDTMKAVQKRLFP